MVSGTLLAGIASGWGPLHWLAVVAAVALIAIIGLWLIKVMIVEIISLSISRIADNFIFRALGLFKKEALETIRRPAELPRPLIPPPPRPDPKVARLEARLAELKKADPNFSEQQFRDLAATVFVKIKEGIERQDLNEVRPLVTPSLLRRLVSLVEDLKKKSRTRHCDQLQVQSTKITAAAHDGPFYALTVRLEGQALEYDAEDRPGPAASLERIEQYFINELIFIRADKVKTPAGKLEPIAGKCPNCGAPIAVNNVGRCNYCSSEITSGDFSWVLSEIALAPLTGED